MMLGSKCGTVIGGINVRDHCAFILTWSHSIRQPRLRFVSLMTDTWCVKRCIMIIIKLIAHLVTFNGM